MDADWLKVRGGGGKTNAGNGRTGDGALFSVRVNGAASASGDGGNVSKRMGAVTETMGSLGTGK